MSDWDYGQGEDIAADYDYAIKNGFCIRCAAHKKVENEEICSVCIREEEDSLDSD